MNIKLHRRYLGQSYTIGSLYIDGDYFCDTLEDKDRNLTDKMTESFILGVKVANQTAIPKGTYKVTITYSPRFKKMLPLINNVKGFSGIRIHEGNTQNDTSGCILVGENKIKGKVINSKIVFNRLFDKLKKQKDIILTIV